MSALLQPNDAAKKAIGGAARTLNEALLKMKDSLVSSLRGSGKYACVEVKVTISVSDRKTNRRVGGSETLISGAVQATGLD